MRKRYVVGITAAILAFLFFVLAHKTLSCNLELGSIIRDTTIEEHVQKRVGAHEAGHAIVGAIVQPKEKVSEIVILTRLPVSGEFGYVRYIERNDLDTAADIFADTTNFLGGRAADVVVNGEPCNGAGSDLAKASEGLWSMCLTGGLCGTLLVQTKTEAPEIRKIVDKCLNSANSRAEAIVAANKSAIIDLADLLMRQPVRDHRRRLSGEAFEAFLRDHPLVPELKKDGKLPYECP